MDAFTLDQFAVFAAIVAEGSFAGAARKLNRAQSAITYAVQKLEAQSGVALFDRSAYRPRLTEAGQALLPRARRILEQVDGYALLAKGMGKGLEAGVAIVIDAFIPMAPIVATLRAFHAAFPLVHIRLSIESMEESIQALNEGTADLVVVPHLVPLTVAFERNVCGAIDLVAVAAPDHPLARLTPPIAPEVLRDHLQLVLSGRRDQVGRRDFGVLAVNRWHVTDLEAKHAMLRAGLGWGSMPRARVEEDLAAGRLVALDLARWEGVDEMPHFAFVVARRQDRPLGPAGRWLFERFAAPP